MFRGNLLSLESEHRVVCQVRKIKLGSHFSNLGMLFLEKPTNMREEESSVDIVGISIGISPLVVATVIARPFNDIILESHGIHEHQQNSERESSLVALVRPESMSSGGDTKSRNQPTNQA